MLYFIEGARSLNSELMVKTGLCAVIDHPRTREVSNGPGGASGILVSDITFQAGEFRYQDSHQTWTPRYGSDGVHVGKWNDSMITPEHLARDAQVPGIQLNLLDNHSWVVPLLRQWRDDDEDERILFACRLPSVLKQSPTSGAMVPGPVVERYRELWDDSCVIAEEMMQPNADGRVQVDPRKLDSFVSRLMNTNYRIELPEISLLGLLDDDLYGRLVCAALDWDRLRELLGKLASREEVTGVSTSADQSIESGPTQLDEAFNTLTGQPSVS